MVLTVDLIGTRPVETPANLADFMAKNNYTFPVLLDVNKAYKSFGVIGTPTNFIIDKNGVIQLAQVGEFSEATMNATLHRLNAQ